jgi:hypothetical protein
MADKTWRTYEEVAQYLLNQFAVHLGLERVEEKQKILGQLSGRQIEIDGRGVKDGNTGFVILECKRYKDRVEAEKLEALAFRITDARATGGIVVIRWACRTARRRSPPRKTSSPSSLTATRTSMITSSGY